MTTTTIDYLEESRQIEHEIVKNRRHIHSHPELSFEEQATARYIAEQLEEIGLTVKTGVGGEGVVAEIGRGRTIALRADMDALPIEEINDASYRSCNSGVMHACGHDAHSAILLGAARIISKNPPSKGRIRFVFQPAEESCNKDGLSGASLMLNSGAFDDVEAVVGLHVFPDLPTGTIALRSGPFLAACSRFDIRIQGNGCHGAFPQEGLDAVVLASHVIQAIQTIASRRKSALEPAVITVGGIKSNTYTSNIIADSVDLTGTIRYFLDKTETLIREELERCCKVVESLGGTYILDYTRENPPLSNHEQVSDIVRSAAEAIVGKEAVFPAPMEMGAEDFSFISARLPSCFFALGAGIEGSKRKLHAADFDIDEASMTFGAAIMARSALDLLQELEPQQA